MATVYEKLLEFKNKYPGTIAWRLKKHAAVVEKYLNNGINIEDIKNADKPKVLKKTLIPQKGDNYE